MNPNAPRGYGAPQHSSGQSQQPSQYGGFPGGVSMNNPPRSTPNRAGYGDGSQNPHMARSIGTSSSQDSVPHSYQGPSSQPGGFPGATRQMSSGAPGPPNGYTARPGPPGGHNAGQFPQGPPTGGAIPQYRPGAPPILTPGAHGHPTTVPGGTTSQQGGIPGHMPFSGRGPPMRGPPTGPQSAYGPPGPAPGPPNMHGAPHGPTSGPPTAYGVPNGSLGPPTGSSSAYGAPPGPPNAYGAPPGLHTGPPGPPTGPYGAPPGPPTGMQGVHGAPPYNSGSPAVGMSGPAPYGAPGGYAPPASGSNYQSQQPPPNSAPKQRIDPNQIPRPIVSTERIQYVARGHTVTMPPPATSDFVCMDEGTCNPRFIRPTLNHVPTTKDLLKQCGIPLAMVICPLAQLQPDELPIPLVDFGPQGPLRCSRCRAYVNSYTKFIQGGRKFVCNICLLPNETPRDYYCSVDQLGQRRDIQERAELCRGSVDYVVPSAYTVRPPQEPIFVFVLDVSLVAFQTTLVQATLDAIVYLLPSLAQNKRKKIGIITFDHSIHYYRMDHHKTISICTCPDIDDPIAPLPPSSWLVSMEDPSAQEKIKELSQVILKSFKDTSINQAVSGAALTSVVDALKQIGGRVILLHAGAPRMGIGRMKREEITGMYGTTKEVELYTPEETNYYETLGQTCAASHISVDVFSVANTFSSLADIGRICELTGGRVFYLPQFEKEKGNNQHHLTTQLQRLVERENGYEAVLKVRVSAGLRIEQSCGNFYSSKPSGFETDEMEFAIIDQDRSICVTLAYDETLNEQNDAYIQAALLYTRSDGIRCVRVHNLALPIDSLLSNIFRFADLDATCSVWQRLAAKSFVDKSMMRMNPMSVKEHLVSECVQVLYNYRKYCASSSASGQLILPESLKLLPLYTLATLKSRALRSNVIGNPPRGFIDVRADERVMMMGLLNSLPVEFAVSAVYPKLYSIHDMPEECGMFNEDGVFLLPPQLPPTAEKLDETGIFLLHSAMNCYLYIGSRVSNELLYQLFGTNHVDTAETTLDLFQKLENEHEIRTRVRDLVEYLNSMMPCSQPLEILSTNDWRVSKFMSSLVEDRTRNDVSYVEFLVQVHKKIQHKFH